MNCFAMVSLALVAWSASAAVVKSAKNTSNAEIHPQLRAGRSPEAKLYLPEGAGTQRAAPDAELKSELDSVVAFSAQSPLGDDVDLSPSSVQKMEKAVTDLVTNVDAATPMGSSVKQIKDLITKTMLKKVNKAHNANQKELNRLAKDIGTCGSSKSNDEKVAK